MNRKATLLGFVSVLLFSIFALRAINERIVVSHARNDNDANLRPRGSSIQIPVSSGTNVTVWEQTSRLYHPTFSVSSLMGTGGTFHAGAEEDYSVSSDGVYLKIHCVRSNWLSGFAVGNNIVAVKLNGVPGYPNGLWATELINYTLGYNGIAESRFNALGNVSAVGPFAGSLCTYMGDQHSELVLGFSIVGHDIEVTNIEPSAHIVGQGSTLPINVTVTNRGEVAEHFDVTTYYDSVVIETQTVSGLDPMMSKTLTFNWDTTGVPYGKFTIKAEASVVPGETKTNNNILIDGAVRVAYPHDVAIVSFMPSPSGTTVSQNLTVNISVKVENQGLQTETFNVTLYANSTAIGTQTVSSLASGVSITLTFSWDTTIFDLGNYIIKATANTVPGEIDTADNTLIDGTVTVTVALPSPIIISNGILEAVIESNPGLNGVGTYTIRTGPNHPNPGQNVFYDGTLANPWSTFSTIHVNTTLLEYVTTSMPPISDPGYVVVAMDTLLPAVMFNSTKVTIMWWTLEPLLVIQEIGITGTTVSDTKVRVTLNVTNVDDMVHLVGIRYEWDLMIDGWDGSWVRTWALGSPNLWLRNETEWIQSTYEYWETTNYPLNPLFYIYGSISLPAGSTPPDRAIFAHWGSSFSQAYSYTPTGQVIGGTSPSAGGSQDSAMLYYWNFTLNPCESRNVTASIWVPTIHDVVITNVTISDMSVARGETTTIPVEVMNQGTEPETFNVTVLANSTMIGTQTVSSLASGTHLNLAFDWNTTAFNPGNYTLSVAASIVPDEIDIVDNIFIDSVVIIMPPIHDVAVINVTPSRTIVGQNLSLFINVTVENQGGYTEAFNVTAYYYNLTGYTSPSGLVGYWKFDEGSGTTAYDSSAHNNNGTLYNDPTWTDGKNGKALSFDGIDDYVRISHSSSQVSDSWTIEAWVYPAKISGTSQWGWIIHTKDNAVTAFYRTLGQYNNKFHFLYTAGGTNYIVRSTQNITANTWYHLVLSYNDTTRTFKIYIDGELDTTHTAPSTPYTTTANVIIGARAIGYTENQYFNGTIDEVRIYNRTLSEEEIVADMMCYGAHEKIGTKNITLPSGDSTTITLTWNTTGVAKGNYTITSKATQLPGETDTTDNTYIDGWILVTILGDINGDFEVDVFDKVLVGAAFGATYNATDGMYWHQPPDFPGPCTYCPHTPNADINGDFTIDVFDKVIVGVNFGQGICP